MDVVKRSVLLSRLLILAMLVLLLPPVSPRTAAAGAGARIAQGWEHTVLLKADGTVWAWGQNYFGGLGNGTTTDSSLPVQVEGLSGVTAVSAGGHTSLALKSDGTVWAWGDNTYGQLGNGSTTHSSRPVKVRGLSDVTAIAAGVLHAAALKSDGTVWTWGYGGYGGLGNGSSGPYAMATTPVQVPGLTDVKAVFGGSISSTTYAVKSDGSAWAWGGNAHHAGLLGSGATVESASTPVQVTALSGVTAVAAGNGHAIALKSDGTVWVWGYNAGGEFGNGSTSGSPVRTPEPVPGLTGVTAIAAGYGHSLALRGDGTVWAWGGNSQGQVGDGTTQNRTTVFQVPRLSEIAEIGAGQSFSVALGRDGAVWTWGYNGHGQLGDGSKVHRSAPGQVSGLGSAGASGPGDQPSPDPAVQPSDLIEAEPAALAGLIARYQSYRQSLDRYLTALANDRSLRDPMLMVNDLLRGTSAANIRSAMDQFSRNADEYTRLCAAVVPENARWFAAVQANRAKPPQLKTLLSMEKVDEEQSCRQAIVQNRGKAAGAEFALTLLGSDEPGSPAFQRRYDDWQRENDVQAKAEAFSARLTAAEAELKSARAAFDQAWSALAKELAYVQARSVDLPPVSSGETSFAPEIPEAPKVRAPEFNPAFQEALERNRLEIAETRAAAETAVSILRRITWSMNGLAEAGACGDDELADALRREVANIEEKPLQELQVDLQAAAAQREPFWPADPNNVINGIVNVWRLLANHRPACPGADRLKVDLQDAAVQIDEISWLLERRARFWVRILELYRDSGLIEDVPDQNAFAIRARAVDLLGEIGSVNPISYAPTPQQPTVSRPAAEAALGLPALVAPADGAAGLPTAVMLQWQPVAGSSGYLVEAARDAAFTLPVVKHWEGGTSMLVEVPAGAQIFWRVSASNGEVDGPASEVRRFTTATAAAPLPPSPTGSSGAADVSRLRAGIDDLLRSVQEDPFMITDDWRARVSLWASGQLGKYNNLIALVKKDRSLARDALLTARKALDLGDVGAARQHYQKASLLYFSGQELLRGAADIAEIGVTITRQAAVALYRGSVTALKAGLTIIDPKAAEVADWITTASDYAVNYYGYGAAEANAELTNDLLAAATSKVLLQQLHIDLDYLKNDASALPQVNLWIAKYVKTDEFREQLILSLQRAGVLVVDQQGIDRLVAAMVEYKPDAVVQTAHAGQEAGGPVQPAASTGYRAPIGGRYRITAYFGDTKLDGYADYKGHSGIDLVPEPWSDTAEALAAAAGVVVTAGADDLGYGRLVVIQHPDGLKTLYGHLASVKVRPGQQVVAGEPVGIIGREAADALHLHFEVQSDRARPGCSVLMRSSHRVDPGCVIPQLRRVLVTGVAVQGEVVVNDSKQHYDRLFSFDAAAGQVASIRMEGQGGGLDPYLYLYAPDGTLVARDDNSGGGTAAFIGQVRLPQAGSYRVAASSSGQKSSGTFRLTLTLAADPATPSASRPAPRISGVSPNGPLSSADGMRVCYPDGVCKVNGSKSWRNNNPGNLRGDGLFVSSQGAIGVNNGMAVFPSEEIGWQALLALLESPNYRALTISGAIYRYAPPGDGNDTEAYIGYIESRTGLSRSLAMSSLSADQRQSLARAIKEHEGWTVGEVFRESLAGSGSAAATPAVPARNGLQWVSIRGSDFTAGARVTLTSLGVPFKIPPERTQFISASEIRIQANFTDQTASWTAEVTNPDGRESDVYSFMVSGGGSAPAAGPVIDRFAAGTSSLTSAGGSITLGFTARNATTCSVSSSPGVEGLPATVDCSNASRQISVSLPANSTGQVKIYTFTLTANGAAGAAPVTARATVTVGATAVSAPAPHITGVSPNPVPGLNGRQWVSILGRGFASGVQVTLVSLGETFVIPADRTQFISSGEIRIYANFTLQPAAWTAQVANPDGRTSNIYSFSVR